MEKNTNFVTGLVVVKLGSPILMRHSMTLDSILGGIIWQFSRDGEAAGRCEMVGRDNGVPLASRIFLVGDITAGERTFVCSIPNQIARTFGSTDLPWKFTRRILGGSHNLINTYPSYHPTGGIAFLVHGDLPKISTMIKDAVMIGTAHTKGGAKVLDVEITELDCDPRRCVSIGGTAIRPVPLELGEHFEIETESALTADTFFHNPYRPEENARLCIPTTPCIIPDEDLLWVASVEDLVSLVQ